MKCNKVENINTYTSINNRKAFFLDTNVLYWYTYPRYGTTNQGVKKQAQPYYDFVDSLVSAGNPLYTSVYNLSELLNVIENNEFHIFDAAHPELHYSKKDFRKNSLEREKVKKILTTTFNNATSICKVLGHDFTYELLQDFTNKFTEHRCDPFDYIILDHCVKTGNLNIISDDNDFSTIPDINLFTANETTLNAV
jgi:predicted nucleic acid-binding protein